MFYSSTSYVKAIFADKNVLLKIIYILINSHFILG